MKTCIKCGEEKPLDMFYRNCDRKDGRLERCKACVKEYEQSPAGRERKNRWNRTPKGQACRARNYPTPEKMSKYMYTYNHSEKGKKNRSEYSAQYKNDNPNKIKAQIAVKNAIMFQGMVRPTICEECGCEHYWIHAHHESYEPEHRLDVQWLCPICHGIAHSKPIKEPQK